MKVLRRISLLMIAVFIAVLINIKPANAAMSNIIMKNSSITSMTSKTDLTVNLDASNLSAEDQDNFDIIKPMIDNLRISTVSKMNKNSDNTISNNYMHLMVNLGGTPIDTSIWASSDLTGKTPSMKEIVRVPKMFASFLPEDLQDKEYAVIDLGKQLNKTSYNNKLIAASSKLTNAIVNSLGTFSQSLIPIKDRGTGTIKTSTGLTKVHNYTIKLDVATLKFLMKYSVNNLATNHDVTTALKDYIITAYAENDTDAKTLSKQFDEQLPGFLTNFNDFMDSLKNVKVVGKKGIVINYSVDNDGYIVNANGIIDLVLKASDLKQITDDNNSSSVTNDPGVYNLSIKFNTNVYDINKGNKIIFPYLDKNNSFDLSKAMTEIGDEMQNNTIEN